MRIGHCLLKLILALALAAAWTCASATGFAQADVELGPDAVVVCPRDFLAALKPWLAHRQGQGHRIALITRTHSAEEIRQQIRRVARSGQLQYVMLVGDAPEDQHPRRATGKEGVPTHFAEADVTLRWGSEPRISTDNWYADLDDDQLPDVAVGRLTADTPDELAVLVRKTLAYETNANVGLWRRRVNFIAGVGGFGPIADAVVETVAKRFITEGVPSEYDTSMTYASWRSPYSPDPRRFQQRTIERFNEGCLAWVYLGHGTARDLDRVRVPGAELSIFSADNAAQLAWRHGAPIAVFLSCHAGAFDYPQDCLAEEVLRSPSGPVAVVCGSRLTMPYAMAVLGNALLEELFAERGSTLGQVMLEAKRKLALDTDPSKNRRFVDAVAGVLSLQPDELARERREHVLLFNLLGDPMLRIRWPGQVQLDVPEYIAPDQSVMISGKSDVDGVCLLELVCRRDRQTRRTPPRREFDSSHEALVEMDGVYERVNDCRWAVRTLDVRGGQFATRLLVPGGAQGPCHVRVFVQGDNDFAMGAADVYVRQSQAPAVARIAAEVDDETAQSKTGG